jgi:hypothetical protein
MGPIDERRPLVKKRDYNSPDIFLALIGTPNGGIVGKTLIIPAEPGLLDEQTESSFVLHHP